MLSLTRKTLRMFNAQDGTRFRSIFMLVLVTSFLEVIGISSIMPFLAVVADPQLTQSDPYLSRLANLLGANDPTQFALWLGFLSLTLLVLSNVALALSNWKLMRVTYGLAHSVSLGLLERYMRQPFEDHLRANTAESKKNLLDEAVTIVNTATVPFMQALAKVPVVILVLIVVVLAAPLLSLVVVTALGALYYLAYRVLKKWLGRAGDKRLSANAARFRLAQEALDAFSDIRLLGLERRYEQRYSEASRHFADALAESMTLATTPRYIFEIIAFGGILLVILYLIGFQGSLGPALPLVTLYALSGYRLMPAMQVILSGLAKARFAEPALDLLLGEMQRMGLGQNAVSDAPAEKRLQLKRQLSLHAVEYTFPGQATSFVSGISLIVPPCSIIGITGATGSGKTTLSRLILGLLLPTGGEIRVDGVLLDATTIRQWQRCIAYVPQQIYLADSTVEQNIAFGLDPAEIDRAKVIEVARVANVHDFVEALSLGYKTPVGEHGAMLSGGQRQRIAIARALYRDPDLLVFDEATSALDHLTEELVMDAIQKISASRSIVLIAHRLNTLHQANCIHIMEKGRIVDSGDFAELTRRGRFERVAAVQGTP